MKLNPYNADDRVRLIDMPDDPDPIPVGTEGTVFSIVPFGENEWIICVKWDNGRTLGAIVPPDKLEKVL